MHPAIEEIATKLVESPMRQKTHEEIAPRATELCQDRDFLHDAIKRSITRPGFLDNTVDLTIHLAALGDVMININIFVPTRDGGRLNTQDNIHHHGWRLLTTGILSGEGYDTIEFVPRSHEKRDGDKVLLEVQESYHHAPGKVRYIGEHAAHVVFQPDSTTTTLAIWSADKPMMSQSIKRSLQGLPGIRKTAVKCIRALGMESLFGVNKTKGLYYHPFRGHIEEMVDYRKPWDGTNEEMLNCMFHFFQQVDFTDSGFWSDHKKQVASHVVPWIDKLLAGEPIPDRGIWGHPRRRFTRTQILQAIDNSHPADERKS
ncbi:MAG: hypothetical protein ACPGVU_00930 [Limisphaerales bacterium]